MIHQLTFTRFLAAMVVVLYHYGKTSPLLSGEIMSTLLKYGNSSVSYFFILSGFVMIIAYGNRKNKLDKLSYYISRIARIYPIYILALFAVALIAYQSVTGLNPQGLLLQSLLVQSWFPAHVMTLNTPGWSLSVEVFFYLLFPLLLGIYNKFSLKSLCYVIVAFWLVSQIVFTFLLLNPQYGVPAKFLYYAPIMHLNQFLVGNLIGFLYFRFKKKNYDIPLLLLIVAFPFLLLFVDRNTTNISFHNGLTAVYYAPFILLMALNNGRISSWLSKGVFVILGEISYGIYILQKPVHSVVRHVGEALRINDTLIEILFFVVLLGVSYFLYMLIELPGRQFIKARYLRWKTKPGNMVST
ncbi:acyltransferase family protein [Pedobacter sp.]|uniref:acyltransferase family protein n=1 Tax=Pedobacter sp. TaxID=1411316 RepID=UPI003D7F28FC